MFSDADYSEEKIASTIYKINAMKMSKFAELTKIPTILLDGMPGNKLAYIVRVFDHKRPNKNQIGLGDFSSYDSSIPAYWDLAQDMNFYLVSLNEYRYRFFVYSSIISKPSEYDMKCLFDEIGSGILAARSARFECVS